MESAPKLATRTTPWIPVGANELDHVDWRVRAGPSRSVSIPMLLGSSAADGAASRRPAGAGGHILILEGTPVDLSSLISQP
jgi:hypothetical protein